MSSIARRILQFMIRMNEEVIAELQNKLNGSPGPGARFALEARILELEIQNKHFIRELRNWRESFGEAEEDDFLD